MSVLLSFPTRRSSDLAYVGGGFRDAGLHSLLEPAAFGAPVIVGPRHTDNRDANLLVAAGGAFRCADSAAIEARITRRSEEHTSELQSPCNIVCSPLLE